MGVFVACCHIAARFPQQQGHVIDNSSEEADGIRSADVNGDQRLDLVTGGQVDSPEDAVFVDLDVLTCEETDNPGVIWYENPFAAQ